MEINGKKLDELYKEWSGEHHTTNSNGSYKLPKSQRRKLNKLNNVYLAFCNLYIVIHWRLTTYLHLKCGRNNYFLWEGNFSLIYLVYMKYIIYLCSKKFN